MQNLQFAYAKTNAQISCMVAAQLRAFGNAGLSIFLRLNLDFLFQQSTAVDS